MPLTVIPVVILLPVNDPQLKEMIDNAIHDLEYDGAIDAILEKYKLDKVYVRNHLPMRKQD